MIKKILIGLVVFIIAVVLLANFATQGIADVAQNQLSALRSGDSAKAYSYTSKDFQKATSLEAFKTFVKGYPSLSQNESASFTTKQIENNLGTLKGSLKAKDGSVTPVEYQLVKEGSDWKILNLRLNPTGAGTKTEEPSPAAEEVSGATVSKILINDAKGSEGIVDANQDSFSATTPEIFVSAYLSGSEVGSKVSAELTYLDTGDKVGPATNDLEDGGDIISNFSFSKPTKGWPEGNYTIRVYLSTGASKSVNFSVK